MENVVKHGQSPFSAAFLHGGPGAAGEMSYLAEKLSKNRGILEPLQTKCSIEEQVEELHQALHENVSEPVSLLGYSWGAWLALIYTVQHPKLVKKLILLSSGPLEENYAQRIMETRLTRLSSEEKEELKDCLSGQAKVAPQEEKLLEAKIRALLEKSDGHDLLDLPRPPIAFSYEIYAHVNEEAKRLRKEGVLVELLAQLSVPIVAIHGEYDPHPYQGVEEPLRLYAKNFQFHLIKDSGHCIWRERRGEKELLELLERCIG